jgi:hypothetical protein
MAYEETIRVKYIDRKGEKGSQLLKMRTAPPQSEIKALTAYSYCGTNEYAKTIETKFTEPQSVGVGVLIENDKDFKAILGFEGASGFFRISWPAPKINIEGGFTVRWGSERAFIPPAKEGGETGDDGNTVAAKVATLTGDSTVKFVSGHIYKRA